jgi:class 3 adenylate cyclase/tetratricopeptide (TPR) repeat protein
VICPNCASENDPGAKFCNECGAALSAGCPNCGATNKPGAKFCNECGTTLVGSAAAKPAPLSAPPASPSAAERRVVTVLFADLVGFTPFAEERDAEEVRETLTRYFDLCSQVIGRYGGTVEKFIGDAVMAVWGAPIAHEDDAERAVRAAIELVDAVRVLAPNAQARAGVLTGEAAVTLGATNQGMVAGDMVNTAARLQSVAPAGSVLVGEATYRAANEAIVFEQAGEQLLKGKESPVPAWRAVRVVAERGGRNRKTEGLEAPFVGRTDELRLLKDLFHATGREKKTRLVSVMGPAGIGKSRLAWEFLKYVDGLVETMYWHSGRSPAYGEGITFWALSEMVRSRCGLAETDDEETTRAKVAETVATWVPDEDQRAWIEKALLVLLGLESDMPSDQLFGAWRTFFERIAEQGTVALVFEDMHHADSGLLDFVDHMLEWSRGFPIYIVTLTRPDLLDRRPDWGAGKRNFSSIYLEPLGEADMRQLLAGLVPGLPEAAIARIVERADGIPLYAVETVRMLVADGRLKEEGGVYVPLGDLATLAVPDTLSALISSRLDSLAPADRSLVHDAAVLGQSFTVDALSAISGVATDDLEATLSGLVRREVMTRELDARSAEKGQYAFMQALIREVAYNTLSKNDRKVRHLAAARYFEQLGSDELASVLAGHYLSAHANAPSGAEADALAAQARIALKGAGDRASSLGANDQAARFFEQAIAIATDPGEVAVLHERAGLARSRAARSDDAEAHFRRAVEIHVERGDRQAAARAMAALGETMLDGRRNTAVRTLLEAAVVDYADLAPDESLIRIKANLARALLQLELNLEATRVSDEVLDAAEHADMTALIGQALVTKGAGLASLGRQREGIALIRAAEKLARDEGLDHLLSGALAVASAHLGESDPMGASASALEALEVARRLGRHDRALLAINNFGYNAFLTGDWDRAITELDGALTEDLEPNNEIWLSSNSIIIHAARGDDVTVPLREVDRLVKERNEPELTTAASDARAHAAFATGDYSAAARHWRDVAAAAPAITPAFTYQSARCWLWLGNEAELRKDLAAFEAAGFHGRVIEARHATLLADVAALEGRMAEATNLYRDALVRWHDLGLVWDEALTGIDVVTVLDRDDKWVRSVAESTRSILERLRATPSIHRLDELSGRPPTAEGAQVENTAATGSPAAERV